jgi:hypothetical protein
VTDKQTVVDTTKTAAEPAVTGSSAQDDVDPLDKLLAEYDQSTKPAATLTPPETKPAPQPAIDPEFANRMARVEKRLLDEDIAGVVKNVAGDLKIPAKFVRGWLNEMASERPEIDRAFQNKAKDPTTWARIEKSLNRELAKDYTRSDTIDENATVDREAVTAAIRGASAKVAAEPAPDFGRMSDGELREYNRKNFGF